MGGLQQAQYVRFAIAYGLSIPFGEGPEIRLPSQLDPAGAPPRRQAGVDYRDHKDVYD
jgi:hypothetical protein